MVASRLARSRIQASFQREDPLGSSDIKSLDLELSILIILLILDQDLPESNRPQDLEQ